MSVEKLWTILGISNSRGSEVFTQVIPDLFTPGMVTSSRCDAD